MPFAFDPVSIQGACIVRPTVFGDARGTFMETYQRSAFVAGGIDAEFVQDNASTSKKGVLRGLHLQVAPHAQGKLVSVSEGAIFDVCADVRPSSPTFGMWHGVELRSEDGHAFYVPPGCAHGYLVLTPSARVHYKCTAEYAPEAERGIRFDDPELAIHWPHTNVTLSDHDAALPTLDAYLASVADA